MKSPWFITIGLFLVALFVTTRHNDYPYYYEKDAHSKVAQVVSGERNFYHPPLMLNAADAVLRITGKEFTNENAITAGRFCMAFFTSGAIAAFALLAYRLTGPGGAVATGAILLSHQLVYDLSHHFKEDPALVFGLGLSFAAMQFFWEKKSAPTCAAMGIAAALAVSGKYVGIAALPMALFLLILGRKEIGTRHWLAFFSGYLATIGIVDHQFVMQLGGFKAGFETEIADLTRNDKLHEIPHIASSIYTLKRFIARAFAITMLIHLVEHFRHHRRNPVRWLIILYPVVFLNILVWSPRLFTRHFLPVFALLLLWVGLTIPTYARWISQANDALQRWRATGSGTAKEKLVGAVQRLWLSIPFIKGRRLGVLPVSLGLTAFCLYIQAPGFAKVYNVYANPTREKLIDYINQNLPADALILYDTRVYLHDRHYRPRTDHPIHCDAITRGILSSFNSLEEIYALGVTHVAAHNLDSRYLFHDKTRLKKALKQKQPILEEIFKNAREVCYIPSGASIYIAPGLLLYELPPPPGGRAPKATQNSLGFKDRKVKSLDDAQAEECDDGQDGKANQDGSDTGDDG